MSQYSPYPYGSNPADQGSNPYNASPSPETEEVPGFYLPTGSAEEPTVISSGSNPQFNPYAPMIPPPPPPARPSRSLSVKVFVVLGLVMLLVLAGILFGAGVLYQNAQTNNAHATATALAARNATAQANSIATAISSTATASANASATAVASHYPFSANLVLNDPMYDNSHGNKWFEYSGAYGHCRFTQGAFHVSSPARTYLSCFATATNFSDFTYEVKVTITQGDYGGLIFRANSVSFYTLLIGKDGSYSLFLRKSDGNLQTLGAGNITKQTTGFYTGYNQANFIGVVVRGNRFDLYANGQHFASATDSTLTSGYIGVIAYAPNQPTEVAFSDAKVWLLP